MRLCHLTLSNVIVISIETFLLPSMVSLIADIGENFKNIM